MSHPKHLLRERRTGQPESFSFPALSAELTEDQSSLTFTQFAGELAKQFENYKTRDTNLEVIGVQLVAVDFQFILGQRQ